MSLCDHLSYTMIDYVLQVSRFDVIEGLGCNNSLDYSILYLTVDQVWETLPGLISVVFYYRECLLISKSSVIDA